MTRLLNKLPRYITNAELDTLLQEVLTLPKNKRAAFLREREEAFKANGRWTYGDLAPRVGYRLLLQEPVRKPVQTEQ